VPPATPLGVQLYTLRDPARFGGSGLGLDVEALRTLADIGVQGVETVDVPGGDPVAARRVLDDLGLAITSSHSWAAMDDLDGFARGCEALAAFGSPRAIVSGPALADLAAVERFAEGLRGAAAVAADHGLAFGYHNHSAEMQVLDGSRVLDRLAALTGPDVDFQVDIFWVRVGGADPAEVVAGLGDRVVSLHLKDGATLPADPQDTPFWNVPVGSGVVDPRPVIAIADASPRIEWLIAEFDYVEGPPLDGVRTSIDWLRRQ
jgi:sugar phosphate isomerase/epimerase